MRAKINVAPAGAPAAAAPARSCPHRAPLLWIVIPFLAGAVLERIAGPRLPAPPAGVGAACAALAVATSLADGPGWRRLWAIAVSLAAALIAWAGLAAEAAVAPVLPARGVSGWTAVHVSRIAAPHRAPASARGGPARSRRGWLTAGGSGTVLADTSPALRALRGREIYFSVWLRPSESAPARDATVILSGTFKPVPRQGGPDSFGGYLRGLGVGAVLSPAWFRSTVRPPSAYARAREALAAHMNALLEAGFERHPDLAAVYRAMMLGRKEGLTPVQHALFLRSGTLHLFAINGLHIGIVALSAHALLALLRLPRGVPAALLVLGLLWIDVDSTGAAPSALRAFLMVAAVEGARAAWLPMNPLAALTAAAAVLLARRPADVFSASFQMSFAVVLTLILLGTPLAARLRARLPRHLASTFGFAAAATLCSTLSGIAYFGTWSPVSLPANLALMPLATLVIIAGFASLITGLLHAGWLSRLFNAAACLLLRGIVAFLQWITALPAAAVTAHFRAAWIGPAALALFLALCFRGYAGDWRRGFAAPFIAVAITLLLGVRYGP